MWPTYLMFECFIYFLTKFNFDCATQASHVRVNEVPCFELYKCTGHCDLCSCSVCR